MPRGKRRPKPITPENMRQMALDIIKYLNKHGMFYMINIYAGGMHYSDDRHPGQEKRSDLLPGIEVYAGDSATCPCEYSNPDTLTMTFEGPLYHAMNYGSRVPTVWADLDRICARYGLYHEMGHAWSLTCYENPDIKKEWEKKGA